MSLLHNFILQSLNLGSAQVQILLSVCQRLEIVRISDTGPGWKHTIPQKQFTIIIIKIYQICHVIFRNKSQFFFKLCIIHQCLERQLFCTFSSKTLHLFEKRNPSKCKLSDFQLLAKKLSKFLMQFFKSQVSFPLNFASPLSVMTQNSTEIMMLWKKRAHQNTDFYSFMCFHENSPNSSCQFWNHQVIIYSNFAFLCNIKKYNSSVFFWLKPLHFGQKSIFRLLNGWVKVQQFPYVMLETSSKFF